MTTDNKTELLTLLNNYEYDCEFFEVESNDIDRGDFECEPDEEDELIELGVEYLSDYELDDLLFGLNEGVTYDDYIPLPIVYEPTEQESKEYQTNNKERFDEFKLDKDNFNKVRIYVLNREISRRKDLINVRLLEDNVPNELFDHISSFL